LLLTEVSSIYLATFILRPAIYTPARISARRSLSAATGNGVYNGDEAELHRHFTTQVSGAAWPEITDTVRRTSD